MLKSTNSIYQLDYPANNTLTPIRDGSQEYFPNEQSVKQKENPSVVSTEKKYINPYAGSLWISLDNFKYNREKIQNLYAAPSDYMTKSSDKDVRDKPTETENARPIDRQSCVDGGELCSDVPTGKCSFLESIHELVESEEEYALLLDISNEIYRKEMNENKKYRQKLLSNDFNDELLLFGNLDTISSLSKILVKTLNRYTKECSQQPNITDLWSVLRMNNQICDKFMGRFDPTEFFESHLNKIKLTYITYSISYRKQAELLVTLKKTKTDTFYKWYGECLPKANYVKLEDIIIRPLERLNELRDLFLRISVLGKDFMRESHHAKFVQFIMHFTQFLEELQRRTEKSNTELTNCHSNDESVETTNNNLTVPHKEKSCASSESHYSPSSSWYSEHSSCMTKENSVAKECQKSFCNSNPEDATLNDWITKFKRVHKNLEILEKQIIKNDLMEVLDKNLEQAKKWKNLMEFEPSNPLLSDDANIGSIYESYIEKIHQQRQNTMILKLADLQVRVLGPLTKLIECCTPVKTKIENLKSLKKDYIAFLGNKQNNNIKVELIAKHFKLLQTELLNEMPLFLDLVHRSIELLLLVYNNVMMRYMVILSGGESFLDKEMQLVQSGERDIGDHFDILQLFSSSRFYTKQVVREHCRCRGKRGVSRVVRKLFEL